MAGKIIYMLLTVFLFGSAFVYSQKKTETFGKADTPPELKKFEEIIEPVWYKAYPAKDYLMLRSYTGEIKSEAKEINKVKLPAELKDKKIVWDEDIKEFKKAVKDYVKCLSGSNDDALLDAAEELHLKFEELVRVFQPLPKEIDDFNKVFYVIYHKYLPSEEYYKIFSYRDKLIEKAEAVSKLKLQEKFVTKSSIIHAAADDLFKDRKRAE